MPKTKITFDENHKFIRGLRRYNKKLSKGKILKKFMQILTFELIVRTPVDEGRARAGWARAAKALGTPIFNPGTSPARKAQGEAEGDIKIRLFSISIINSVPYIGRLDRGWSAQNRVGILSPAMKAARAYLAKIWHEENKRAAR